MKKIKIIKKKHSGRDTQGRVAVRHQGGEHKRYIRLVDFRRDKHDVIGKVVAIEYDPNRTCDVALIQYGDGERRYILSPEGLKVNDKVISGKNVEVQLGNALPLQAIPVGTIVHSVELTRGKGGQLARSAGTAAIIQAKEGGYAHLKLPSGEVRLIREDGYATIGQLGNVNWKNEIIGSAGRARRMGIRPTVRGTAQSPRSHPHGGGEGRSGIGMNTPKTYKGRPAVGKTRNPNRYSNKYILQRRSK